MTLHVHDPDDYPLTCTTCGRHLPCRRHTIASDQPPRQDWPEHHDTGF